MRLLFLEDDCRIAEPTIEILKESGYEVTWVQNGEDAIEKLIIGEYPLAILDVMVPQKDGFEVAKEARENGVETSIVFLTARTEVDDRVFGLDIGADAYLTKPFAMPELLATLRAITRRERGQSTPSVIFANSEGKIDTISRTVFWKDEEISVTGREYALLETLVLSPDRWFSREELLDRVWGAEFDGEARIVDVYIRYLRRKLAPEAIRSERGRGYRALA